MQQSHSHSQSVALGRMRLMRLPAEGWALVLLTPIVMYLAVVNLGGYPPIGGWDEGIFLQFASNVAHYGEYATRSGDVFERLMPLVSVGPTVIAPTGLALLLGNDSLAAARAVPVAYLLIAVAGLYLLMRHIGGWVLAIVSIPLFLTAGYPAYDTLWLGRQVLGEVAALAFGFLGIWVWLKSWHGNSGWLIASTFLIGLAVITKNQLIWLFGPSIALIALIDRLHHHQLRLVQAFAPLTGIILGYGVSLLFSLWIVGPSGRASYFDAVDAATSVTLLHTDQHRWLENAKWYGRLQWLIAVITINCGFYRGRVRSLEGLQRLVLPLFASIALLGFVGLSLPWPRNLHSSLAFVALCSALLIYDLAHWLSLRWKPQSLWTAATLALAVGVLAGPRLVQDLQRITTTNDACVERFATLVDQQVPVSADILNWEWDVEFYSRHSFVHPPYQLSQALFGQIFDRRHDAILDEPRIPPGIEYLIVGPFSSQTQLFTSALEQRQYRLLGNEGQYYLYRLY